MNNDRLKFRVWDNEQKKYINPSHIYLKTDGKFNYNTKKLIIEQWIIKEDEQDIFEGDKIEEWKHNNKIREFVAVNIRTLTREYDNSQHDSTWKIIGTIHDKEVSNE